MGPLQLWVWWDRWPGERKRPPEETRKIYANWTVKITIVRDIRIVGQRKISLVIARKTKLNWRTTFLKLLCQIDQD